MSLLDRFSSCRLLVLGDVILDRYWWGDSTRLSPEAPVPVVRRRKSTTRAGGAANTAANLVSLGARVTLFGVVGADSAGVELREAVRQAGIEEVLVEDPTRPTTSKTRVIALQQQVVRVDEEETAAIPLDLERLVLQSILAEIPRVNAVVLSDYAKGFLTPSLTRAVIEGSKSRGIPTFVDPKGSDYQPYMGCTVLKPNRLELGTLVQQPVTNHRETLEAGRKLQAMMPGTAVLVTESVDGMTLFTKDAEEHVDAVLRHVFDVTGAGDTVLAALALAWTAGAGYREALELASQAASIVVGEIGTATVTREQLRSD